ncbi:MAG TPA: hypothetical protein VFG72_16910, partial [Marmoricola sp.]|nr:hypothetical protein [Marmoricola sp.]
WPPFASYFPDGLRNSDGELVTDLIDECVARDIHQQPCHARWVECPDREHQCFYMDRNNPVWREYLKAVIRIQVDAGVGGIQLDEAELPMGAFQYGACFCKDCMKGFRAYLSALPVADPLLEGEELSTFHYGEWLLARGHDFQENREGTPLFGHYYAFQCQAIKRYFAELAGYARDYGRSVGRDLQVSGNFFNCEPMYLALVDDVDLVITEMRNTTYRQPEWYRYVSAFAGGKDVVVVENPYGGVVPELIELLGRGRGYDLYRLSAYEAAAMGASMSVPYGSWMGSVIEDAYYAPHALATEVQAFLAENDRLFAKESANEVAVVFNVASTRELIGRADASDNITNARDSSVVVPYRVVTEILSRASVPFDVVIHRDGVTAEDRASVDELARYATVVLPDCHELTPRQAGALLVYLDGGGTAVVVERFAENLAPEERTRLLDHPRVHRAETAEVDALLPHGRQVTTDAGCATNLHRLSSGAVALHLVNYDYDASKDAMLVVADVEVAVRLEAPRRLASVVTPEGGWRDVELRHDGDTHVVALGDLGVYAVVVLHDGGEWVGA